jgi:hypothetical protein
MDEEEQAKCDCPQVGRGALVRPNEWLTRVEFVPHM